LRQFKSVVGKQVDLDVKVSITVDELRDLVAKEYDVLKDAIKWVCLWFCFKRLLVLHQNRKLFLLFF
jgi:hypothetical protein